MLVQFFDLYEKLLTSPNYVTRRQSLKVSFCYNFSEFSLLQLFSLKVNSVMLMDTASLRIPFGASKFPYNEALYFRSSVFESHDDIAEGIFVSSILFSLFFEFTLFGAKTGHVVHKIN